MLEYQYTEKFNNLYKIVAPYTIVDKQRLFILYQLANHVRYLNGDFAEVGVYKGGTAKLICEAKGNRELHLFDTFEGLPELGSNDDAIQFKKGFATALLEDTKDYLSQYQKVYFYKGLFPKTATPIKDKTFSFVHLDVDLYQSTHDCIEFFYPRMAKGGIIISHDYITAKGVKKAFDEFFSDKPEIIFELLSGEQCLVIKL